MGRVTRLLVSLSSFLCPRVDDTSITEPSATDDIPMLLLEVLPVFLDVDLETAMDESSPVREITSVPAFLLEPTPWAVRGTPVVVLDDDEAADCDGFARFFGGLTLAL